MNHKQPELTDEWGCTFYGKAETITGDVWWYVDSDGVRRALMPKEALAAKEQK